MTTSEVVLLAIALLLLARIVQAWIYHERRQRLLSDLATMIGDYMDAAEERTPAVVAGEGRGQET